MPVVVVIADRTSHRGRRIALRSLGAPVAAAHPSLLRRNGVRPALTVMSENVPSPLFWYRLMPKVDANRRSESASSSKSNTRIWPPMSRDAGSRQVFAATSVKVWSPLLRIRENTRRVISRQIADSRRTRSRPNRRRRNRGPRLVNARNPRMPLESVMSEKFPPPVFSKNELRLTMR